MKKVLSSLFVQLIGAILWALVLIYPIALTNGYDTHGDVRLATISFIFAIFAWNYYYPLARTFFPNAKESTMSNALIAVSLIPVAGALWHYNVLKPQWLKRLERLSLQKEFDEIVARVKSNPLSHGCQDDFDRLFELADQLNCHICIWGIIMEARETLETEGIPATLAELDWIKAYQDMVKRGENKAPVSEEEMREIETEQQQFQTTLDRDEHNLQAIEKWRMSIQSVDKYSVRALIINLRG